MKIIKEGKLKSEEFEGKCHNCGCIVAVSRSELRNYWAGDQREPGESGTVTCPTKGCGHSINCYKQ